MFDQERPCSLYPIQCRSVIEADLRALLEEARRELKMDTGYMGFLEEDRHLRYPDRLRLGDAFPLDMPYTEGMVGLALTRSRILCWPDDPETLPCRRKNDDAAKSEIAGPLRWDGKLAGAIWFASHRDGLRFTDGDRECLRDYVARIEELLRVAEVDWSSGLVDKLRRLAEQCLNATDSDRAYLAVERPDKDLEYFKVGNDIEKFLPLNRFEGLCGRAFQRCETLNCTDVLKDESYRPSHPEVRSELVVPIVEEVDGIRRSIALINLESYRVNNYSSHYVRFVEGVAEEKARLAVRLHRERAAYFAREAQGQINETKINKLLDFAETTAHVQAPGSKTAGDGDARLGRALRDCARELIGAEAVHWWPDEQLASEDGWEIRDGADGATAPRDGTDRHTIRVLDDGETVGILGAVVKEGDPARRRSALMLLKAATRLGAALMKLARRADRSEGILALSHRVVCGPDEPRTLVEVVHVLRRLLESRHCTLFLRVDVGGRKYLVPGPTTSGPLTPSPRKRRWYYTWDPADGATSFVAVRNRPVVLSNLRDDEERRQISPDLTWGKTLAEQDGAQTTAFMAWPVNAPADRDSVLGVIRMYRDENSQRTKYSDFEVETFGLVASLLSVPVASFLRRYGPGGLARPAPADRAPDR